jgi:pectinesterase
VPPFFGTSRNGFGGLAALRTMLLEPLALRFVSSHFIAALTVALVAAGCSDSNGGSPTGTSGSGGVPSTSGGGGAVGIVGGSAPQGGSDATAGTNAAAGANAVAGAGGTMGGAGGGGAGSASAGAAGGPPKGHALPSTCKVDMLWTGSPMRPQLTDEAAACFTVLNALAAAGNIANLITDNWDPTAGLPAAGTLTPTFTVASDDTGTHKTVQAAIDAANAAGGTERAYILVKPGTYHAPVCVKGTVPITLYGADADATKVVISFDNYSGKTVPADLTLTNPCKAPSKATFGTSDSTTLWVASDGFQAMNLTIANDFVEPDGGTFQAVALSTTGDKLVFQNIRLLGNQDTLQPSSLTAAIVARAYYKSSYVEGDTDFIFGRGVAVFDDCDIAYIGTRKSNGAHFAPSTDGAFPYGFLVTNSRIVAGTGAVAGAAALGRAWDSSSEPNSNGEVIVLNSKIDNHVTVAVPWKASTSGRVFDAATNRLFEYKNTGAGAAP